jgi:hypothetical protein
MTPITGSVGCCVRAASGHVAAMPPTSVMNSRRWIWFAMRTPHAILARTGLTIAYDELHPEFKTTQ